MAKITYEIFDSEAEITEFIPDSGVTLELFVKDRSEGFITFGHHTLRLTGGRASIDVRLLDDGSFTPVLIEKSSRTPLPSVIKQGKRISVSYCDEDFVRALSIRERRLCRRVKELEEAIAALKGSVYGSTIL